MALHPALVRHGAEQRHVELLHAVRTDGEVARLRQARVSLPILAYVLTNQLDKFCDVAFQMYTGRLSDILAFIYQDLVTFVRKFQYLYIFEKSSLKTL